MIYAHDIGKTIRFHVNTSLVSVTSARLSVIDPEEERDSYTLAMIDTTVQYVDHVTAAETFHKDGNWQVEVELTYSGGNKLHGRANVQVLAPF